MKKITVIVKTTVQVTGEGKQERIKTSKVFDDKISFKEVLLWASTIKKDNLRFSDLEFTECED